MGTRHEPALLLPATNLLVEAAMGGGNDTSTASSYPFDIYCNSAHCPLVSAVPTAPGSTARASGRGEGDAGGGSSRWRKRSPAISCSLLICTVQLQTPGWGTARWRYPPAVTARLCPAQEGSRHRAGRAAAPAFEPGNPKSVQLWVFFFFLILVRANSSGCNASPDQSGHAGGAMTGPGWSAPELARSGVTSN